ncbi:hypothetical protein JQC72_08430 [Polycladomyces sp. WAk]|uniref:Uncharacterized protein n=1 Tax=Polycladomyces zharkentensis TaxID=2807616 RepID=A0ABS2WJ38_9BACL|nr:hypothetical protein [Polycladomyces sp. WAk]MBN2909552.1 hypothetical protein [Polycladomyces sp. WAk]
MIFCTVTTLNRIHMAMAMARSAKEHHPDARVAVCIVEEQVPLAAQNFQHFDHIVLAKDLGHPDFYRHMFKYQLNEGCYSLKPWLLLYLLQAFPANDRLIYLDTDTKVFGPFHEVNEALERSPIVVTPHLTHLSVKNELLIFMSGLYNSGFLALNRNEESKRFLHWWAERLDRFCYNDVKQRVFYDQKWLDHAPIFFEVHILKHPGYNVAWWNRDSRKVALAQNGEFTVNGQPLRFYHFCGFPNHPQLYKDMHPDTRRLVEQYRRNLLELGFNSSRTLPCSYDCYRSGEPIDLRARLAFRNHPERFARIQNPFSMSNRTFLVHVNPWKRKVMPAGKGLDRRRQSLRNNQK